MKRLKITLFLTFFCISLFSQKMFIDENMIEIDSLTFNQKCKFNILKCLIYKKDSVFEINKVLYKYSFGKIKPTEAIQLKKLLKNSSSKEINPLSNIIIHYRDSLYNFQSHEKKIKRHFKKHKNIHHSRLTFKSFTSRRKKWIKKQRKCMKKVNDKFSTETFYVYKYDNNAANSYHNLHWIKDRGLFKNKFFNIMYNTNLLVIKPNGDYFSSGGHLSKKMLFKLLKHSDWSSFKKDWKKSYQSLHKEGYGLFKKQKTHQSHCF